MDKQINLTENEKQILESLPKQKNFFQRNKRLMILIAILILLYLVYNLYYAPMAVEKFKQMNEIR